jgi:hypothetical protein
MSRAMGKLGLVMIAGLAVVGCGKQDDKGGGGAAAKPVDVAAVNALVPASLKDKLVFEQQTIVEERGHSKTTYTVAAPKGWKQEMKSFAKLEAPDDLGFMTSFDVGTNCDGECQPKDWASTVDKVYSSYLKSKVIKDQKSANARTIIASSDTTTLVVVATWREGDKSYSHCGGTLDNDKIKDVKEVALAFEKACESVSVSEE